MADRTDLPIFIKPQYGGGDAFGQLVQEARRSGDQAKQAFDASFAEIGRMARQALSVPRNQGGALDLGAEQYREAARDAEAYAISLREIATAAAGTAARVGDTSVETQRYVQAARAAAIEAEREARELGQTATAHERLQQELNQTRSATERVVAAQRQGTDANGAVINSTRAMRNAMVQGGQQLQDIAIQFQAGTRSSTILAQQLPQLAFAFSGVGGAVGAVARTFSGPWSLALVAVSALAGSYIDDLLGIGKESDKAKEKTYDFSRGLDVLSLSAKEAKNAMEQLGDAVSSAVEKYGSLLTAQAGLANKSVSDLEDRIESRRPRIAKLERLEGTTPSIAGMLGLDPLTNELSKLRAAQEADKAALALARQSQATAALALEQRKVNEAVAAGSGPLRELTDQMDALTARRRESIELEKSGDALWQTSTGKNYISEIDYNKKLIELTQKKNKLEEAQRGTGSRSRNNQQILADFQKELAARGIGTVPNPVRTAQRQNELFRQGLTPLDGYKEVSRHQNAQAIDFNRSTFNETKVREAAMAAGLKGFELITESGGRKHAEWSGGGKPGDVSGFIAEQEKAARAAETAANEMARLAEFAADADDRIGRMRESFADTPPAIAQMLSGMAALDDLSSDIEEKVRRGLDPKIAAELQDQIAKLRPVIEDSVNQPFKDMVKTSGEQAAVQDLLIAGRQDEAEALARIFDLQKAIGTEAELQAQVAQLLAEGRTEEAAAVQKTLDAYPAMISGVRDMVTGERLRTRELEKQNELRQREIDLIEGTRDNIRDTMQDIARGGGAGAIGDLFKRQFDLVLTNAVDNLFEKAFGDFFRDEKDKALGFDKVREASDRQVASIEDTTNALAEFSDALRQTAASVSGSGGAPGLPSVIQNLLAETAGPLGAANDNGEIVVNGRRQSTFLGRSSELVARLFVDKESAKTFGDSVSKALTSDGAAYGAMAGGFVGGGGKGSALASSLGGALGEKVLGPAIGKGLGKIASSLGSLGGPIGGIIGGIAGSLLSGLMTSTPRASATIGGVNGSLGVVSTRGNSAQFRKASEGGANEAIDSLDRIAEALGATIDASLGSVSIGVRKGKYRVDTSGQGITKTSKGAIDFGEDSAAAIRAATMDLIKDGVLQGLKDSTRRLLQGADDLDKAIKDALDFEGVFTRLKELKDPAGAALDALNKEFERLIRLFERAGASTQEFAALEELYGLERVKAMKEANEAMTGPLRDLIKDLETGDNGLSLRARRENALAKFNPLADAIRSGRSVDYSEFSDAARTLLDIQRQIFGSQTEYFTTFNDVLGLSKQALAGQENVISIADASASPFSNRSSADTVPVVAAVDAQSAMIFQQLSNLNASNDQIAAALEALNKSLPFRSTGTGGQYF